MVERLELVGQKTMQMGLVEQWSVLERGDQMIHMKKLGRGVQMYHVKEQLGL